MNFGKKLSILTVIVYVIFAHIGGTILNVHWLHVFSAITLLNILYHLLEWKYEWIGQEEEENHDENNNN